MKEHIKRRYEYSKGIIPEIGTSQFDRFKKAIQKYENENPHLRKEFQRTYSEAIKTWELQSANGIGLFMDTELRQYLSEFNHRSWNFGHRKMPLMFNIIEAFFDLDKRLNYWTLLDEEDYSISFFDFIDYYTSNDVEFNSNQLIESFEEDLIYNFNVNYDFKDISFKTTDGSEYVIAGVSLVRRGNEVTMLFNTGQIIDTEQISKELIKTNAESIRKGKEMIKPANDKVKEAVKLNDDKNLWKILIACRFDLESSTIEARYVAKDAGDSYIVLTDDVTGFMAGGNWREDGDEELFKSLSEKIENYNSIFELAKACLLLPDYLEFYNDEINEQIYDTTVKSILRSPFKNRQYKDVNSRFKIRNRTLWILNRNNDLLSDRFTLRDENYKVETTGYWRKLEENEMGTDKKGEAILHKTWVHRTESYYVAKKDNLIVQKKKTIEFKTKNAGYIYIMRNSNLEKNIYKIGLTSKETIERAKQLSNTSIPDDFSVMREWAVKDCYLAEKRIHKLLETYRVDPRREFFKLDMREANDVIDSVVADINEKL